MARRPTGCRARCRDGTACTRRSAPTVVVARHDGVTCAAALCASHRQAAAGVAGVDLQRGGGPWYLALDPPPATPTPQEPPPMLTTCPVHHVLLTWQSPVGPRCPLCGARADGAPPPDEDPEVRSFAFYRACAARTDHPDLPIEYMAGSLCEEAGEFWGRVKKVKWHGHPHDAAMQAKMVEELGDCLWYLDRLAARFGTSLETVVALRARTHCRTFAEFHATIVRPCDAFPLERHSGNLCYEASMLWGHAQSVRWERQAVDAVREYATPRFGLAVELLDDCATGIGESLAGVARANVAKLRKRYRDGFSSAASIARVDVGPPAAPPLDAGVATTRLFAPPVLGPACPR